MDAHDHAARLGFIGPEQSLDPIRQLDPLDAQQAGAFRIGQLAG
jgi:hypothetical protein